VGNERAHVPRLSEGQGLTVVGLTVLGIEPVGVRRDVAEQVERVRGEPGVRLREFHCARAQALRLTELADQ
jgi:hypothetical protein